jgi:hypothetical protein
MNATFLRFLCALAVVAVVLTASAEATVPAGRFTVAADDPQKPPFCDAANLKCHATVTDTKTKLVWQQTTPSTPGYTWANAKAYCQTVGASLGGAGWRLPTIKELQTLVDDSMPNGLILPTFQPGANGYWSSSSVASSPTMAWIFDYVDQGGFFSAGSMTDAPPSLITVRCVR